MVNINKHGILVGPIEPKPTQHKGPQRAYLLSRLKSMYEAHAARIRASHQSVVDKMVEDELEARRVKVSPPSRRQDYKLITQLATRLTQELADYKKMTGINLWEHNDSPINSLFKPTGKPIEPYSLREKATEHNLRRLRDLSTLYQDARGQILFKDKAVALDYIELVERKAAKI